MSVSKKILPLNKQIINNQTISFVKLAKFYRFNRIKPSSQFGYIMRRGINFNGKLLSAYFLPKQKSMWRVGVACSKQCQTAVQRNYYKRRLRIAWQANYDQLKALGCGFDVVLIAKFRETTNKSTDYIDDLASILQKLALHAKIKR